MNISIETIALRETAMRKHLETDATVLQEQLLQAHAKIAQLEAELKALKPEEKAS